MRRCRSRWIAGVLCGLLGVAGCMSTHLSLVPCPLSPAEQVQRVREVAPLGTTREEVVARLKKAGIRGNFGENESIFYCDVWEQKADDSRWHMNVTLLFDEQGKLYATRPDEHGQVAESPRSQDVPKLPEVKKEGDPFL